jgi:phenylacetate-CoA ligase
MGRIAGRSDDMLIIRGVNVFPTQIEEQILRDTRLSGNYQIVVTRDSHLDDVEIRCELQRAWSGRLTHDEIAAISGAVQHHIKTLIGISTHVTVLDVDALPRSLTGKAKRVLDQRARPT